MIGKQHVYQKSKEQFISQLERKRKIIQFLDRKDDEFEDAPNLNKMIRTENDSLVIKCTISVGEKDMKC